MFTFRYSFLNNLLLLLSLIFLVACSSGGSSDESPTPVPGNPTASFSVNVSEGPGPLSVNFNASNSTDPDGGASLLDYAWDFGDGSTGTGQIVEHTFTQPGVFTVTLTVTYNSTTSSTANDLIIVLSPDRPVAGISVDKSEGPFPLDVNFDAASSKAPDGSTNNLTYQWHFGNGDTASGVQASYLFDAAGIYKVTLVVIHNGVSIDAVDQVIKVTMGANNTVSVDNLNVRASKGQVFVTFDEVSDSTQNYYVFRETSPITDVSSLAPVATIEYGSGVNRHISKISFAEIDGVVADPDLWLAELDNSGYTINGDIVSSGGDAQILPAFYALGSAADMVLGSNFTSTERQNVFTLLTGNINTFVVEDKMLPLSRNTGLLVYTSDRDGTFYYAVTTAPHPDIVGSGINSTSISEIYDDSPGAVQISTEYTDGVGQLVYEYFVWEDYTNWDHSRDYYGHRFNVIFTLAADTSGVSLEPLTVFLHGAGKEGYHEPQTFVGDLSVIAQGVYIVPVDISYKFSKSPYSKSSEYYTGWFGYNQYSLANNFSERRVIRYINFVVDDSKFNINPNRVYIRGGSMGGGGSLHTLIHYPHVFASGASTIPWINSKAWVEGIWNKEFGLESELTPVNSLIGPRYWSWQDATWVVQNYSLILPPVILTFTSADTIISHREFPELLQALESEKSGYFAKWENKGHTPSYLDGNALFLRFRKDEAYPAFSNAISNDPIETVTGGVYLSPAEGDKNLNIDWSSSLNDLFGGTNDDIVDNLNNFQMTFQALSADTNSDITIRNAQNFYPRKGASVDWENRMLDGTLIASGNVNVDVDGLVTVPQADVLIAGNRLSLTYPDGALLENQKIIKQILLTNINPVVIGNINHNSLEIEFSIPYNIDRTKIELLISHTGASVAPASGTIVDFTNPVNIVVTAPDASTQSYTVILK